jgi:integrase
MAMRTALTEVKVKQAKVGTKAYKLFDGGGMFLFVTPAGGKLWRWAYRHNGKSKLMTFGRYPDVSLALARKQHDAGRELLATGIDPMTQKKVVRFQQREANENSFATIAAKWREHWSEGKSPRHVKQQWVRIEADVLPLLGARPIKEIEGPELVAIVVAIEARGAREVARRSLQATRQIFRYAIAHGYAKHNPANDFNPADVLKTKPPTANMARIDAKELPELLKAIDAYNGKETTRLALKLMALTFVRTSELLGAKWSEFDLDVRGRFGDVDITAARWNIPAERMKMKNPHIVPLAKQVLALLKELRAISGKKGEYLFPQKGNRKKPVSSTTLLRALVQMGYGSRMTGHGFRGLASTILHERGFNHEHIELQLAHAPRNAVSASYNHALYLEPRSKMMQQWADYLEQTLRGVKVLPFRSVG